MISAVRRGTPYRHPQPLRPPCQRDTNSYPWTTISCLAPMPACQLRARSALPLLSSCQSPNETAAIRRSFDSPSEPPVLDVWLDLPGERRCGLMGFSTPKRTGNHLPPVEPTAHGRGELAFGMCSLETLESRRNAVSGYPNPPLRFACFERKSPQEFTLGKGCNAANVPFVAIRRNRHLGTVTDASRRSRGNARDMLRNKP